MTFDEARKEFAKICPGRYRSMSYELTEHSDGTAEQTCRLYTDAGISPKSRATWREAVDAMRELLNPSAKPEQEITTPQGDDI